MLVIEKNHAKTYNFSKTLLGLMTKRKLKHFAEIETFSNVFQHLQKKERIEDFEKKGRWNELYFMNPNPIVLELGCGKGEYTLGLAAKYQDCNFIGIDIKGNRIWRGSKTALENKIENIGFLRTRIENINTAFGKNEISEIWITFPDPRPRKGEIRKRLTSSAFINRYKAILKPGGVIHLKTDNYPFFQYTLEMIKENNLKLLNETKDLYGDDGISKKILKDDLEIKTFYEKKFSEKGFKICYLKFSI